MTQMTGGQAIVRSLKAYGVDSIFALPGVQLDNIFDARQRVTDNAGEVPDRYQAFLIDPVGRFFEIELRKLF